MTEKIILPKDVILEKEVKPLWKDSNGKYYLDEKNAQEILATHHYCKCGKTIVKKYEPYCCDCQPALKTKQWNGINVLYVENNERFYDSLEEIKSDFGDDEMDDLVIFICNPIYLKTIDDDYWADNIPEDGELPAEIKSKLDKLNKAIENYKKPIDWIPTKYIATFE